MWSVNHIQLSEGYLIIVRLNYSLLASHYYGAFASLTASFPIQLNYFKAGSKKKEIHAALKQ